jgi:hypothetical protein
MESKKSQGRSLATVAGSVVLLCAVLLGAAYFLENDAPPQPDPKASPATSSLHALLARCDEKPVEESVDGRTKRAAPPGSTPVS